MSGPKRARVYRTPVSRVAAARADVQRAIAACASSQGNGLQEVIADAEKWLSSLRRESVEWRNPSRAQSPSVPSSATIQKLERMREELSLSVASEQRTCESLAQAQIAARSAMESAQRALSHSASTAAQLGNVEAELGRAVSGVDRARRVADQAKRRIERQRAEFEAYYSRAVSKQSGPESVKRQDDADEPSVVADAAASAAARTKLSQQLAEVSRPPEPGWADIEKWAGGGAVVERVPGPVAERRTAAHGRRRCSNRSDA